VLIDVATDPSRYRHWRLAVDGLAYFDHWITPPNLKRRFDIDVDVESAASSVGQHAPGDCDRQREQPPPDACRIASLWTQPVKFDHEPRPSQSRRT
jgi:hypothetical protein